MHRERILTGIRSNGQPHLGNYLGAMLPMARLQQREGKTHEIFFFVPDLHSFVTPIEHETLYESTIRNLRFFIAAGFDFWAEGAYLYRQSFIPAHSELTWILNCFAYFGEMSRMTQFKDKKKSIYTERLVQRQNSNSLEDTLLAFHETEEDNRVTVGLFDYPLLMAADILLYNARYVPVGDDQQQHLELTRDVALRMNHRFASSYPEGVFPVVPVDWAKQKEFAGSEAGGRVRSLRDPHKKMSKSVSDPAGTIDLMDDPQDAARKVMAATTDSAGKIAYDWQGQPGIANLLEILALLTGQPVAEVTARWTGKASYGELKQAVAKAVAAFLTDFQAKVGTISEARLIAKLEADEAAAREIANKTLLRVQQAIGLRVR